MAINVSEKGKRGEMQVRDLLRDKTGLKWERVPGSGAFNESHALKGDVYLPPSQKAHSVYCYEVKWYKDDQLNSNIFNVGTHQIEKWWEQATREAEQMNMKPALVFKKDKGEWLIALDYNDEAASALLDHHYIVISKRETNVIIGQFKVWLHNISKEEIIQ